MCSWCCTAAEAADCDVPGLGRVELTEVGNDDVLVELADAKVLVQGLADDSHTCRALRLACHLPEAVGA